MSNLLTEREATLGSCYLASYGQCVTDLCLPCSKLAKYFCDGTGLYTTYNVKKEQQLTCMIRLLRQTALDAYVGKFHLNTFLALTADVVMSFKWFM